MGSRETTPVSGKRKIGTSSSGKFGKALTLEERAEIPSMLFYTMLNRVRQTGVCQLSYSGGTVFKGAQLRQLISLATSIIADGGGGLQSANPAPRISPLNLNEQIVEALDVCSSCTTSSCPVQSLILCNAPLRPSSASVLAAILQRSRRSSSLALVSVVLANVPLASASVVSVACALAQSPSCLQQLVLERCAVGSAGAAAIFEALAHNRALWKLDLSGNHIADAACPALAHALLGWRRLARLETLALLQNPRVSSMGVAALRQAAEAASASVAILDFGSQYSHLIARRVRELHVFCELYSCLVSAEELRQHQLTGIILSGGPQSVFDEGAPHVAPEVWQLIEEQKLPVLGICYGLQELAFTNNGKVAPSQHREYGKAIVTRKSGVDCGGLFEGLPDEFQMWMSHGDKLHARPDGFVDIATTENSEHAAIVNVARKFYGIQFHPR
ncbi:GMP synthase (glutamine-hydrolyzing) domain-containing protein [Phytophthora cinnamomi]|uniref:GMP synthase (glutamine-hydrolyzing) domain-containing protein n=1 Tax=Phytophthora cinnamomi TaxID=4785 RepID=UPI0035596017|nr:GMP synthase (glutamine-hydrolyzing) domain-containing protein [Phytophthora cinnamomi]